MIDIVIPLNNQSHWDNNELRYALRSVEMYLTGVRDVYIIGTKPHWIKNVKHFKVMDMFCSSKNIYHKVNSTVNIVLELSDPFLFMNDDHFFLHPYKAAEIPLYYDGKLSELMVKVMNQPYKRQIWNTINALLPVHTMLNFDIHTPILYEKDKFRATVAKADWNQDQGFCIKSLYCNMLGIEGEPMSDVKIIRSRLSESIDVFLLDKKIFSIDDMALNNALKRKFETLYPKKSKYEI